MLFVIWIHLDLIVPWEAIHKRHSQSHRRYQSWRQ